MTHRQLFFSESEKHVAIQLSSNLFLPSAWLTFVNFYFIDSLSTKFPKASVEINTFHCGAWGNLKECNNELWNPEDYHFHH